MIELGYVADVFNGKTPSKAEQRLEGLPVLKIRDIDENGKFIGKHGSYVDQEFYSKYAKKKLCTGDTIILNAAHNADYVGNKNALVTNELNGVIATGEWLIVRPKEIYSRVPTFHHDAIRNTSSLSGSCLSTMNFAKILC